MSVMYKKEGKCDKGVNKEAQSRKWKTFKTHRILSDGRQRSSQRGAVLKMEERQT